MKYNWDKMNDTQKINAIDHELELVTHNGTTKDDLLNMLKFMREQFEVEEVWGVRSVQGRNTSPRRG